MGSSTKTIVVVGATGNQGCSVTKTFLSSPHWHVRALTRSPSSEKAESLKALGAEVVQADMMDTQSLKRAFAGAHAIFLNTDFWLPYRQALNEGKDGDASSRHGFEVELQHGKNVAAVAEAVPTLERLVYSALGPMKKASAGKYPNSHHWDSKAAIVDYIETECPQLAPKTSYIYMGAYSTNAFLLPQRDAATGQYAVTLPAPASSRWPIVNPETSTGPFVRALVEEEEPQTKLLAYDSLLTMDECVKAWSDVTGKESSFVQMERVEMSKKTGIPLEILDGPSFIGEFGYMGGIENYIEPHQLKTKVATPSYAEFVGTRNMEDLLGSKGPRV